MTINSIGTNKYEVSCEAPNCNSTIIIKCSPLKIGDTLQKKGWSWLRGDEMYDHICSLKCLQALAKAQED